MRMYQCMFAVHDIRTHEEAKYSADGTLQTRALGACPESESFRQQFAPHHCTTNGAPRHEFCCSATVFLIGRLRVTCCALVGFPPTQQRTRATMPAGPRSPSWSPPQRGSAWRRAAFQPPLLFACGVRRSVRTLTPHPLRQTRSDRVSSVDQKRPSKKKGDSCISRHFTSPVAPGSWCCVWVPPGTWISLAEKGGGKGREGQATATENQPHTSSDTQTHPRRKRRGSKATWDTANRRVRCTGALVPSHSLALWLGSDPSPLSLPSPLPPKKKEEWASWSPQNTNTHNTHRH